MIDQQEILHTSMGPVSISEMVINFKEEKSICTSPPQSPPDSNKHAGRQVRNQAT